MPGQNIDTDKIKQAVTMMLEAIGENPEREGLVDTPARVARMYQEIFEGLRETPQDFLKVSFTEYHDELVLVKDIPLYSMCEHHLLPFYGKAHIAYISSGKVVGLSKLARTVEVFAKRPQLQERMTRQIADAIFKYLNAKGVMVIVESRFKIKRSCIFNDQYG